MNDNVVFLAKRSGTLEDDTMAFLSCSPCKNKTFTLTYDRPGEFPLLRCGACGAHHGRVGFPEEAA